MNVTLDMWWDQDTSEETVMPTSFCWLLKEIGRLLMIYLCEGREGNWGFRRVMRCMSSCPEVCTPRTKYLIGFFHLSLLKNLQLFTFFHTRSPDIWIPPLCCSLQTQPTVTLMVGWQANNGTKKYMWGLWTSVFHFPILFYRHSVTYSLHVSQTWTTSAVFSSQTTIC